MNYLNKLERKIGKYAIPNLSLWIVLTYAIGYIMMYMTPGLIKYLTLEPALILGQGQVWRLVTWILIPPSSGNIFFYLIMMMLYYSLGTSLERTWGTFRFNVYIFGGMFFTVLGAFATYGFYYMTGALTVGIGYYVTTYYINMAIFLAFAVCFPDMQILLWFIIPVKMKWMAYVYAALTIYDFIRSGAAGRIAIVAALLNFLIFYLSTRNYQRVSPKEIHRKRVFRTQMREAQHMAGVTKHKCAICGRTEEDDPTLEFRFCSKCDGNYEYCQDHLFTHEHIKR
ncbi:MAG: hypothetical protein HFI37_09690 [Lachnospiraceae bacterium]|nr:hypothetical protein [Lachnospiraceae bacterium]